VTLACDAGIRKLQTFVEDEFGTTLSRLLKQGRRSALSHAGGEGDTGAGRALCAREESEGEGAGAAVSHKEAAPAGSALRRGALPSSEDSPSTCAGASATSSPEVTCEGWQGAHGAGQGAAVPRGRNARFRLPPQRSLLKTADGCGGSGPGYRGRGGDELYASPLVSSLSSSPAR
jgi:hypothetical protein